LIVARYTLLVSALLLVASAALAAQSPCTPPEEMKPRLQGKPTVEALNDLGVWFGDHKQFDCAANVFATALQTDPNQKDAPHVAFEFGVSLELSGDTKEAIPALQEAEQLGYRDLKLHVILAQALESTHAAKDAEEEWRKALQFDPEFSAALDALSSDLLADKDFPGVIAVLEVPRLLGQRTPLQCLNLAAAYDSAGKPEEAARVLRDGLNTSADSLAIANQLAATLVQLHRRDEALALLELTVAHHPEDEDAKAMLAKVRGIAVTAR
jgi:tetratricopeptide (TPR) repeat protein